MMDSRHLKFSHLRLSRPLKTVQVIVEKEEAYCTHCRGEVPEYSKANAN